jgi:Predicted membrane protein (DUF2154).
LKRNSITPVIIGLILVIVGVGYVGNVLNLWDFTIFFKGWWTMFIILPCIVGLVNHGFNMSNFVGLIVGLFLLVMQQTGIQVLRNLMFPVILIGVGLMIVFKNKSFTNKRVIDFKTTGAINVPSYTAVFSSKTVVIKGGEVFRGASATSIFGGIELDLRKADIQDDIVIDVDCVFAGMDIKLPAYVNVESNVSGVFVGTDVKRKNHETTDDTKIPTVTFTGSSMFAGITVK